MSFYACLETNRRDRSSLLRCLRSLGGEHKIKFFSSAWELLAFVVNNAVDVAFVSSATGEVLYVDLLKALQRINKDMQIVLMSSDKADAYEAIQLKIAGFLLKPVDRDHLSAMLVNLSQGSGGLALQRSGCKKQIYMTTMPRFNMYVNDEVVNFRRKKGKELLAFLVNANGEAVDADMVVEALWEGEPFGRSQKNRCFVLMNYLKNFLKDFGLEGLLITKDGQYRLNKEMYSCDLEDMLAGDKDLLLNYDHKYMLEYSWSENRRGIIDRILEQH